MYIAYDERGDLLNVRLRLHVSTPEAREFSGERFVEYDNDGPVAIEFLHASEGIDLDGMPEADAIAQALQRMSHMLATGVRQPA
jgi:uncharacterized protein YuzE